MAFLVHANSRLMAAPLRRLFSLSALPLRNPPSANAFLGPSLTLTHQKFSTKAAPGKTISKKQFEDLQGQGLLEFLRSQNIPISPNTANRLLHHEVNGKVLLKPRQELEKFLSEKVGLVATPANLIAEFISKNFADASTSKGSEQKLSAVKFLRNKPYFPKPIVKERSLVTDFGAKLPFLGRGQTEEALLAWYKLYQRASVDDLNDVGKSMIYLPIITGTPGIGKTRALQEVKTIFQKEDPAQNFVTIYISYNSGSTFNEIERKNPSFSLFLRVFSALYSVPGGLNEFIDNSFKEQDKLEWKLSELLKEALVTHQLPENTIFILALDEVQYSFKAGEPIDKNSYFGQVIRCLASLFLAKSSPQVLPIFASTATTDLQELILQGSTIPSKQIPIKLLSVSERHQIVEKMVAAGEFPEKDSSNVSWKESLPFLQALAYAGANPRSLETCLEAYAAVWIKRKSVFLFEAIPRDSFLSSIRPFTYDLEVTLHVIDLWFRGIKIERKRCVGDSKLFRFEDLEEKGVIFLTKEDPTRVLLSFPELYSILLKQINEYPHLKPLETLLQNSMPQNALDPKWFEVVYLNYLATKINLFIRRPGKSANWMMLKDIFNHNPEVEDVKIEFSEHVLVKQINDLGALVKENFPLNSIYHFERSNHPGSEAVLTCGNGGKKVLFFLQIKRRSNTGSNNQKKGSVTTLMRESLQTTEEMLLRLNVDRSKFVIYFVAVTNGTCRFKGDAFQGKLFDQTNTITIADENFKKHVGKFYDLFVPEGQFEVLDANDAP